MNDGVVAMKRAAVALGLMSACALAACGRNPQPEAAAPQLADSTRARLAADSAAAARRDSLAALARRDSVARAAARADSVARVERERARADSVRAQIQRDLAAPAPLMPPSTGVDSALAVPIHFDYDRADLSDEAVRRLDSKLSLLRANPRLEMMIEGHCDERGSDEYNLALGNRRAAAARRYLVDHGVGELRLAITSFGEERPADPGRTEEAWANNRRAEFRVVGGRL